MSTASGPRTHHGCAEGPQGSARTCPSASAAQRIPPPECHSRPAAGTLATRTQGKYASDPFISPTPLTIPSQPQPPPSLTPAPLPHPLLPRPLPVFSPVPTPPSKPLHSLNRSLHPPTPYL
ncbi:hypothetical protein GCM10010336_50730 [Streptomyces goshikiensis]|nr:hypothetical protein GCM10010336_50730 [Streptomyces goshikiensis]